MRNFFPPKRTRSWNDGIHAGTRSADAPRIRQSVQTADPSPTDSTNRQYGLPERAAVAEHDIGIESARDQWSRILDARARCVSEEEG